MDRPSNLYNEVQPSKVTKKKSRRGGKGRKKNNNIPTSNAGSSIEHPTTAAPSSSNAHPPALATPDWPASLQYFVTRCFTVTSTYPPAAQQIFQAQLKQIVDLAVQQNMIWANDWDRQQLPIVHGCPEVRLVGAPHNPSVHNIATANITATSAASITSPTPVVVSGKFDSKDRKRQRLERFGTESPTPKSAYTIDQPKLAVIVGTCQDLEKHYLRLTSEPDPSRVRPENVLHNSIKFILEKYKLKRNEELKTPSSNGNSAYGYLNNQFKSIRQDLTVQHIKNDFTIYVYETHGRIAIENNDLGEFNQCQSQLKFLYKLKRQQGGLIDEKFMNLELEFICYRILYMLMTGNNSEIYKIKLEIFQSNPEELARRKQVRFFKCLEALFNLQSCIIRGNYYHFFRIYRFLKSKPYMQLGCKLIENFLIEKQRIKSLNILSKLYRIVSIQYLKEVLDYANKEEVELMKFLDKYKLSQFLQNGDFDCVQSRSILQSIIVQQGFRKIDIKGQV